MALGLLQQVVQGQVVQGLRFRVWDLGFRVQGSPAPAKLSESFWANPNAFVFNRALDVF